MHRALLLRISSGDHATVGDNEIALQIQSYAIVSPLAPSGALNRQTQHSSNRKVEQGG